jgi:hypothetical protein
MYIDVVVIRINILYALPKGVLIGILFLYIGKLTGSNYKKLAYRNLSLLIRRSNHLYFGKPFAELSKDLKKPYHCMLCQKMCSIGLPMGKPFDVI